MLSGWVCAADAVEIELNGTLQEAAYGTERVDTADICGDADNGFGLLFNWNLLGDGEHYRGGSGGWDRIRPGDGDGDDAGRRVFTRSRRRMYSGRLPTSGAERAIGVAADESELCDCRGQSPAGTNTGRTSGLTGYLENPGPNSFQSGVGVISGWVCAADTVELTIGTAGRQVAAYGTERLDTEAACGDTDNGFGLLFNWNLLRDGEHEVIAYVDGEELGRPRCG